MELDRGEKIRAQRPRARRCRRRRIYPPAIFGYAQKRVETDMPEISYEDFAKLEIRVGTVFQSKPVPETDKLLKCTIDFGEFGTRTIVSGIAQWKKPEDLVGKQLPYVVNLAPKMLRGVEKSGNVARRIG